MSQGNLFQTDAYGDVKPREANPIVHRNDPSPSLEAAQRITRSGIRQRNADIVLSILRRAHRNRLDCTACEIWGLLATPQERQQLVELQEVRRRLTDLQHDGKVIATGERIGRVRSSKQTTWSLK